MLSDPAVNAPEPPRPTRGRPRSGRAHTAILEAALRVLSQVGFRALTVDAIAAEAGVSKTTVYRRWPNKAAVVMDAFLALVGPGTVFPEATDALERIKLQLRLQARFFCGEYGRMIKTLVGEAQFDPELAEAFRDRWLLPRRRMTQSVLEQAVSQGALRAGLDLEAVIDLLYGPIYYRLQLGTGPIDEAFTDLLLAQVLAGLAPSRPGS